MQQTSTFLMRGGLDLITPPVALPPGFCTAALNYESDRSGYRRMDGYERYDGRAAPSQAGSPSEAASRRAAIQKVPGTGPVRGVVGYAGEILAFRDKVSGIGGMYRATASGWEEITFGHTIRFNTGTARFEAGETLTGDTSSATATIERVVVRSGSFNDGDAAGYLVVTLKTGTFEDELVTSDSGSADALAPEPVTLTAGGLYEFETHNFYGPADRRRLYFTNGVGPAFEWDGRILAPIRTGTAGGPLSETLDIVTRDDKTILTRDDKTVVMRTDLDLPTYLGAFANHLFLAYRNGAVVHSGVGEPLDYRTIAGAGIIMFGDEITGFLPAASTAFIVLGRRRVEYIVGSSEDDFLMRTITDGSGAQPRTAQMLDQPIYLDDGGIRGLSTTDAFGDWRMGTLTEAIEPLIRAKRTSGVNAIASFKVRGKDQYRLLFEDGTGVSIYFGRGRPEPMPFRLPTPVLCAWSGYVSQDSQAERVFAGGADGFVYEIDSGNSFDGEAIAAFIRLPWINARSPSQKKRFHKATFEVDASDSIALGVAYHVDYGRDSTAGGALREYGIAGGSNPFTDILDYTDIDWTGPDQGILEAWLDGMGANLALTLVSDAVDEPPHTITSATINFSPRGLNR